MFRKFNPQTITVKGITYSLRTYVFETMQEARQKENELLNHFKTNYPKSKLLTYIRGSKDAEGQTAFLIYQNISNE